jgi:hypothetical protein
MIKEKGLPQGAALFCLWCLAGTSVIVGDRRAIGSAITGVVPMPTVKAFALYELTDADMKKLAVLAWTLGAIFAFGAAIGAMDGAIWSRAAFAAWAVGSLGVMGRLQRWAFAKGSNRPAAALLIAMATLLGSLVPGVSCVLTLARIA